MSLPVCPDPLYGKGRAEAGACTGRNFRRKIAEFAGAVSARPRQETGWQVPCNTIGVAARITDGRAVRRARAKFLRFYPGGFRDHDYLDLERGYKWRAYEQWEEALGGGEMQRLLKQRAFDEIANRAVRI